MSRGRFLAFEGIDATGKSTHAREIAATRNALFTYEPGDTALGATLRQLLLDRHEPMTGETEALLMLADRSHHVSQVIEPTLRSGRDVVSDRFYGSTLAYQGYGRGLALDVLEAATAFAIGATTPDATVLIDLPYEVALTRRHADRGDRFESADAAFHERVRAGFLELAARDRWIVIDGDATLETVRTRIDVALAERGL